MARDDERRGILGRLREVLGRDEPDPPSGAVFTARSAPTTPAGPSRSIFEGVDAWDAVHLERTDAPPADHPDPSSGPPPPPPGPATGLDATDAPPLFPPPAPPAPTTAPVPAPEPRPVPRAVERELEQPGGSLGPPPPSAPPRPVRSTTLSSAPAPVAPTPVERPSAGEPPTEQVAAHDAPSSPQEEPPRPDGHEDLARLAEELTRFAEEGSIPSEVEPRPFPDAPGPEEAAEPEATAAPTPIDAPAPDAPTGAEEPAPDLPTPPGTRVRVHGDRIDTRPGPIKLSPSEAIALARDGRSALRAQRPRSS